MNAAVLTTVLTGLTRLGADTQSCGTPGAPASRRGELPSVGYAPTGTVVAGAALAAPRRVSDAGRRD